MRPSRLRLPLWGPRPTQFLGLVLLVGLTACGSPSPEGPLSSLPSGLVATAGQAPTSASPFGPPAQHASSPDVRRTDASRATSPAPDIRVLPSDAQTLADQAQRAARELWFAELRESPDAMVRLQALETWAQQPGIGINPLTYALVDEDEAVRARAESLYEQQLAREEAAAL